MAQIIRMKRGSLEAVVSATPRAGELLVITGSEGITAANGDGLVMVGIDGSTLTPANKVFQGTATPDFTTADYDTSIDGIPFYRTDLEKLFILNKGGNVEVKATPQTGGTNIYSSSVQVAADVTTNDQSFDFGSGTLTTTGLSSFAIISGSSIDLTGNAKVDGSITIDTNASVGGDLTVTGQADFAGISGSSLDITGDAKIDGNITLGGNLILGDDPDNDSVTFNSDVASDILPDGDGTRDLGSSTLRYAEVHGQAIFGAISASNGVVSGSSQVVISDTTGYTAFSQSIDATDVAQSGRLDNLESFSSSEEAKNLVLETVTSSLDQRASSLESYTSSFASDTVTLTNKTIDGSNNTLQNIANASLSNSSITISGTEVALGESISDEVLFGGTGIATGSSQIVAYLADQATDFGTGRVSGDNFGDAAGTSTFTGSFNGDGAGLTGVAVALNLSSSDDGTNLSLAAKTEVLSFAGTANEVDVTINDGTNTVQIALPDDVVIGDSLTIQGNLTVNGTQTIVDSERVKLADSIIELSGSSAAFGGLYVVDTVASDFNTGSLLYDAANDYWVAGKKDAESKIAVMGGDNLFTSSVQVDITDTTGYTAFSQSIDATDVAQSARLSSIEAFSSSEEAKNLVLETVTSSLDQRSSALEAFSASEESKNDTLAILTASIDDRLGQLEVETGSIESEQLVQDGRLDNLEITSASNIDRLDQLSAVSHSHANKANLDVINQDLSTSDNVEFAGISGSSLDITGDAKIDGNITIGGDLTLGNETGDTIAFSGQVSTDILSNGDNTLDLGASNNRFAEIHGTNIFGAINATNNVVSGSSNSSVVTIDISSGVISADLIGGVVSGSSQTVDHLLNTATDFGTGRVSGDNFGDAAGTSTLTGSFAGDGSSLTGINSELTLSGSDGLGETIQSVNTPLSFEGGTGLSSTVSGGTITYSVQDASTSQKGIASFVSDDFSVTSGDVSIKDGGVRAANLNADVAGTGISLNGVDNSVEVDYGNSAGTAIEGNTTATFNGTTDQIVVTNGSSQNIANGLNPTFALTDDVTIVGTFTANSASFGSDVTIAGDLFVQGTTTTIDATTIQLGDNILELAYGNAQPTAGLLVTDETGPNTISGSLLWSGADDHWMGGALGSEKEFARFDATPTSASVQVVGADGTLVDGAISDDGTDVTLSGDLTIDGLATANSFVYADANKTLQSVQPSNEGDLIQWNGSSFIASNEVDGGTF